MKGQKTLNNIFLNRFFFWGLLQEINVIKKEFRR